MKMPVLSGGSSVLSFSIGNLKTIINNCSVLCISGVCVCVTDRALTICQVLAKRYNPLHGILSLKHHSTWGFPCQSSGQDSVLSLPRAWVSSLTGELRSCNLHGSDKNKQTNKKRTKKSQYLYLVDNTISSIYKREN